MQTLVGLVMAVVALLLGGPSPGRARGDGTVGPAGLGSRDGTRQPDGSSAHRRRKPFRSPAEAQAFRDVLEADAFSMHFQPIVWLPTGEVVGYEGLARFRSPSQRPDQWFEFAPGSGLREAAEVAAVRKGLTALRVIPPDCYVSLNVSPDTLLSDDLLDALADAACDRVVLELTEHLPIENYDAHLQRIAVLRALGVRLAVDDAGAGYSSLRHILILRPDIIKLDRTLTTGVTDDPVRRALLTCLATFASDTRTTLIAEGVETADELAALISYGVAFGQGYHFSRPMPLGSIPATHDPHPPRPSVIRLPATARQS